MIVCLAIVCAAVGCPNSSLVVSVELGNGNLIFHVISNCVWAVFMDVLCWCAPVCSFLQPSVPADFKLVERLKENLAGTIEEEFMLVLSICNTVVTSMRGDTSAKSRNGDQKSAVENADSEKLVYESESPDELALVLAAQAYGFVLQGRTIKTVTVKYPTGELVTFDVLNILQFDATRKRMSVIVRRQGTEEILLLTKGADSAVYSCFGHATGTGRCEYLCYVLNTGCVNSVACSLWFLVAIEIGRILGWGIFCWVFSPSC